MEGVDGTEGQERKEGKAMEERGTTFKCLLSCVTGSVGGTKKGMFNYMLHVTLHVGQIIIKSSIYISFF